MLPGTMWRTVSIPKTYTLALARARTLGVESVYHHVHCTIYIFGRVHAAAHSHIRIHKTHIHARAPMKERTNEGNDGRTRESEILAFLWVIF